MTDERMDEVWGQADLPVLVLEGEDCRVTYRNGAAARCAADFPGCMAPQELRAMAEAMGAPGPASGPLFCHVGGVVYAASLLRWEGRRLCILQDATEYHRANQRALREAVMANQAKTSFLSEMSHDIRTPMGAIMGLTEIALNQDDAPPRVRTCLEKIKVASTHMMSLLNEVLDMSRIESGKIVIQPAPVSVADLLHEILIVVKPQADAGRLQFHLEMGAVDRERILADSVRVKQVCLNLLSNAVKYTPAGGRVELYFAVCAAGEPEAVRMTVRVRDTGIGMSREFLGKLFTPFEREEKSTVNKIQGTGLGMAITKNLVEQMGGTIQVESAPNQGSCFTVEIPFHALEETEDGTLEGLAGRRVLLLDGDERQGRMTRAMLESLSMAVDWAQDADTAVYLINDAELSDVKYLALLTAEQLADVEMMLFLPELRKRIGDRFPILMLSENDWSQVEYMFTRAGVDGFIPMPLFRSRLAAELCARAGQGAPDQRSPRLRRDFSRKRLLLVEDNELNREIALELLGDSGVTMETAEDGRQAVEKFQAAAPFYYDMIFMDIQMPVMNGLEAARAIRALPREDAGQVPIVAMTANAFVEDVQNALAAGMDAHISKPLDMEKVFDTMECFLGGADR